MQYIAGAEFNIKKDINHYVSDRTDDSELRRNSRDLLKIVSDKSFEIR